MDTLTNKEKEDSFETFDWIKKYAPCFVVEAKDIKILQNPSEFYGYLKVKKQFFTEFLCLY